MQSIADSTRDRPPGTSSPPQAHPRRPPAHLSVSLRHESPASSISHSSLKVQPADVETDGPQGLSTQMNASFTKRNDTDDSNNSSEMNAGQRWFDTSNKDGHNLGQTYIEDDSPYFLRHNSSGSENGQKLPAIPATEQHSHRPAVTLNESTDEYRSVIDDLTVENKKLRERLRKYEKTYDAHLERDKLFEVKPHGLPPGKRRELEELLHTFASSMHGSARGSPSSQDPGKDARDAYARAHRGGKNGSSSSTSNSRPIDSAYASGTTSGPKSTSTTNRSDEKRDAKGSSNSKEQHVESFLQDIPLGLHPKHSPMMTEQSKKKMVVRKLEQLFTGSSSNPGSDNSHSHPLQQQEVSNSAAQADRQAIEKQGQKVQAEGVREANMLPLGSVDLEKQSSNSDSSDNQQIHSTAEGTPSDKSPNQRPTRPLDLDPDRAQVPLETVEYIRHLGLSTPSLAIQDPMDVGSDEKGWIYLNLLISMAQLHIINVTPDFVRNAVQDLSTKLQLSQDGRKIRWKGGMDGTKLSSDSSDNSERKGSFSDSEEYEQHTSKRRKANSSPRQQPPFDQRSKHSRFSLISMDNRPATRSTSLAWVTEPKHVSQNRFAYRPLFNHHSSSPSEDLSNEENDISPGTYARDREAASVSRSRSASSNKKRNHEGAIIYYSGAPFCTDLSGDYSKISMPAHIEAVDKDGYSNHTRDAVGCDTSQMPRAAGLNRTMSGSRIVFRPFKDYSKGAEMDWDRPKTPEQISDDSDTYMEFSPRWSGNGGQTKIKTDMTVSGLGAIRPADHFDISVETRRTILDYRTRKHLSRSRALGSKAKRFVRRVPKNSRAIFDAERPERGNKPVKTQIISQQKKVLLPSKLPPPATFISNLSSSSEEDDSSTSCDIAHLSQRIPFLRRVSVVVPREEVPKPETQSSIKPPSKMETHLNTSIDESEDDDGYSEDDDESIDMLAPLRAMDPDTVAAREEEYEKNRGIAAGSNGATVDGGSRFSSEGENNDESGDESGDESEL